MKSFAFNISTLTKVVQNELVNSAKRYIKIYAYLLILCYVISDVKLSHCFLLSKVKNVFPTVKSFRKQYQNLK